MGRLEEMIRMLGRLKGLPNYLWIEETLARLEDTFHLGERPDGIVAFDHNPYLRGMKHFEPLMDAIVNQKVLKAYYYKYRKTIKIREIHPYQLRQFNNRWFLIGMEPDMADKLPLVNLPLDRIDRFEIAEDVVYQTYQGMDLDEYFNQVVGVYVNINANKEKVVLKVGYPDAEYMISKPLHNSQKIIEQNENYALIEMNLIFNYEFETALLGFMNNGLIIEPNSLRNKIKKRAEEIVKNCK
jgi:predicted DNA-binding transcriptional regulator YafY